MTIIRRILCSATILLALLWPQGGFAADIFMPLDGALMPASAKVIEDYAFYRCALLEGELILPSGVTEIGDYAFYDCASLTGEFVLPPRLERIGDYAFYGCRGISGSPYIPPHITVGAGAFEGSSIRPIFPTDFSYEVSDGGAVITGYAGTGVYALRIPDVLGGYPVTGIADGAFENRTDLSGKLTLPDTITSIGERAFYGCTGLSGKVLLPSGLENCPASAFENTGLTMIGYSDYARGFSYRFSGGEVIITGYSGEADLGLIIPQTLGGYPVTEIADEAFLGRVDITGAVLLPGTLRVIGRRAFYGCSGLTGELALPRGIEDIGYRAFYGCTGLAGRVVVPESVTAIGSGVFDRTNLVVSYESIVSMNMTAPGARLPVGHQMQLSVSVIPEDGDRSVIWSSSDETIASVTQDGLVSGLAEGTVTITAVSAARPSLSASVTLTVSGKPVYRALLIGNSYPGTVNHLPGCETDIEAMASMLRTMNATMYDLTIKRNLSAGGMVSAIPEAFAGATEYDVSLIYYTGHGDSTGGRLVGVDGSLLTFARLRAALDTIPGKKIVILDSCYSGNAIGKSLIPVVEDEADMLERVNRAVIDAFSSAQNVSPMTRSGELASDDYYVLTASRGSQQSAATSANGVDYSLFTRCLLRGSGYDQITGEQHAMLADTDSDGGVTLDESYCYVRDHISEITFFRQDVQVYPENCDLLMWGQEME